MSKYIIEVAKNEKHRNKAEKLVTMVYQECGYTQQTVSIKPIDVCFTVKEYDPSNEIIATGTIKLPHNQTPFESEELFGIKPNAYELINISRNQTVELGRFACIEKKSPAFFLLNNAFIIWLTQQDYKGWMAILKPDLAHCMAKWYSFIDFKNHIALKPQNYEKYQQYFSVNGKPSVYYSNLESNREAIKHFTPLWNRYVKEVVF